MSVSRSLVWMGAAQAIGLVLQLASQIVLARYLSLNDAGIYAVALATVGALSLLQALGLQSLIVREDDLTPEVASTIFTFNAIFAVALSGIVYLLGRFGTAFLDDPAVGRVLGALALTPLIAIFSFTPMAMIEREGRFRDIALVNSVGSITGAVVTIALAATGFTYMSAAYAQWATAVVVVVAALSLARKHARLRLSLRAWRRVSAFALQVLAINGVSAISLRLSEIILPRFLGLSALGLFSRASGLNGLVWVNAHLFIGRVMLVDFVALHRQGRSLRDRYLATVDSVTSLLWPLFGGFAVVAGPFILRVLGERWVPATVPLMLLLTASMVQLGITMTWELFTATGQLAKQARIESVRALASLTLFVLGCLISLEAAATARLLDAVIAVAIYRPHIGRMTDTQPADFGPIYARNGLFTLVAVGPAAAVMTLFGWRADAPLTWLVPAAGAGMLLWLWAMLRFRHPALVDLERLVTQRLKRDSV